MNKNSWVLFGMVAIIIISLVLVALLILVPQSENTTIDVYDDYNKLDKSDYTYTKSKDVGEGTMKETYSVTSEDINEGKSSKLYKQGNTNPFASAEETNGGNKTDGTGSNKNGSSSVNPYSADDK